MKYKRKYEKGKPITSLNELSEQELIYCHDKLLHRGWFMEWRFSLAQKYIDKGVLYRAEKVGKKDSTVIQGG